MSTARPTEEPDDNVVARLHRSDDTYEIEAPKDRPIWVNRARVTSRTLKNCDAIEFGDTGPLSRVRILRDENVRKALSDILGDAVAYVRASRQSLARRLFKAACDILRRVALETTVLFRVSVITAIVILGASAYHEDRLSVSIEQ